MFNFLSKIFSNHDNKVYYDGWVEFNEKGFVKDKRGLYKGQKVEWDKVIEIYASLFDCFTYHATYMSFVLENGKQVNVSEYSKGYETLFEKVHELFPGFNNDAYDDVWKFSPGEGSELCWKKEC